MAEEELSGHPVVSLDALRDGMEVNPTGPTGPGDRCRPGSNAAAAAAQTMKAVQQKL
jgi:hypothetical protein